MQICFSGEVPFAIKIDGNLNGAFNSDAVIIDDDLDGKLLELLPLNGLGLPYCFFPCRNYFSLPDKRVIKTDLKGGYSLRLLGTNDLTKKSLLSEKTKYYNLSVYFDKGLKINIETPNGDFVDDDLNYCPKTAKSFIFNQEGHNFLAIVFDSEPCFLVVYHFAEKITKVFADGVWGYSYKDGFCVTKSFNDIAKHKTTYFYSFTKGAFKQTGSVTEKSAFFSVNSLPVKILPFAFFEGLLAGDDIEPYLDATLLADADKLKGYLGSYCGVMPPPSFRKKNEVGLIYKTGENLFEVNYATVEMSGRKIVNLRKIQL